MTLNDKIHDPLLSRIFPFPSCHVCVLYATELNRLQSSLPSPSASEHFRYRRYRLGGSSTRMNYVCSALRPKQASRFPQEAVPLRLCLCSTLFLTSCDIAPIPFATSHTSWQFTSRRVADGKMRRMRDLISEHIRRSVLVKVVNLEVSMSL